jgi:transposase InsO family protein
MGRIELRAHGGFVAQGSLGQDERMQTVHARMEPILRHHGLPMAIYTDNGPPWGTGVPNQWTKLRVWLLKLAIDLIHATPYHPQSRRKNERFHRSLKAKVFAFAALTSHAQAQKAFDRWRDIYNHHRPHQGIDMALPASRYRPSLRPFPNRLPEPADDPHHAEPRSRPHRGRALRRGTADPRHASDRGRA